MTAQMTLPHRIGSCKICAYYSARWAFYRRQNELNQAATDRLNQAVNAWYANRLPA